MYRILGGDGNEYGPVPAEFVIQWINEGRAAAHTQVKLEGSTEWKPLLTFPEFAAALAAKASPGAPPMPAASATLLANEIIARGVAISPGHCIGRSWELFTKHFWLLLGATFVAYVINSCVPLLGWLLSGVLKGGLFFLFLRLIRGQPAEFSDAFRGFNQCFLQLFLAGIVSSLLTSVGFFLCIIPGIYVAVAWSLTTALVIDKNLEFWPAMEVSRRVITAHWWHFFGLSLLCLLMLILGFFVCCVGVFLATPVALGAFAYAYEDIFGASAPAPPKPF